MKRIKPSELGSVLKGLGELAGKDFEVILQKLSIDAFRELVTRSAKDTGFLRSNWDVTTSTPSEEILKGERKTSYSSSNYPNVKITIDSKVVIYNNTEYAMFLELGTPRMRAQPMIEPTYHMTLRQAIILSKALTKKKYNV